MSQWQHLLLQGNDNYYESNYLQAEYCYRKAESLLDNLWQQDQANEELLLAWVCTSHNLAALYEKQGDEQVSLQYLLLPHQRMLILSEGEYSHHITIMAIRSLTITLNPLILYRKKHKLCQACYNALANIDSLRQRQAQIHAVMH